MKIFVFNGMGGIVEVKGKHKFSSLTTLVTDQALYLTSSELLAFARAQADAPKVTAGKPLLFWVPVKDGVPERNRPILMTGLSGYIAPNEKFVVAGYYDDKYRPLSPWQDCTSTSLEDSGFKVEKWCYLTKEML